MLNKRKIENEIEKLMEEKKYLTVSEFTNHANRFFEDIDITSEMVEDLINKEYLQLSYNNGSKVILTSNFFEFNPYSLLSIENFAKRADITEKSTKELIKNERIKALKFLRKQIHIEEFRDYAKKNDVEKIYKQEDLYEMLDNFFTSSSWWDNFYSNREKAIPFFVNVPDENLVSYFKEGIINPKKVLELGCGNGRNAVYMAKQGCQVDAVDMSSEAISWGKDIAEAENVNINYINESIFNLNIEEQSYDFVYDAGCFHHIPPHRRFSYKALIKKALKPHKYFGLNCFNGKMGAKYTDWDVYEKRSLGGGLAYNQNEIENIFTDIFKIIEFREMKEIEGREDLFGNSFMWAILFQNV